MKKTIILFLISLLIPMSSSSQTISGDSVLISTQQLKQTNLIFLEHDRLRRQEPLLKEEISVLKSLNSDLSEENRNLIIQDSIKTQKYEKKIHRLKNTTTVISGASLLAIILLILI